MSVRFSSPSARVLLVLCIKVVGIRALEMKGNKAVFDVEMRWASNMEIVLEAGVKPIPLMITLDKVRFSGKMRIELAPLVPVVSCTQSYLVYACIP